MYKFNYEIPGVEESGFGLIKPMLIKNVDNLGVHEWALDLANFTFFDQLVDGSIGENFESGGETVAVEEVGGDEAREFVAGFAVEVAVEGDFKGLVPDLLAFAVVIEMIVGAG